MLINIILKAGEFIKLNDLPFSFYSGHAITVNNNIYLFGGVDSPTSIYKYNIDNDEFAKLSIAIPFGFEGGALCAINQDVFLFGGNGATAGNPSSQKAYKFNTNNNTFTQLSDIPVGVLYGAATPVENNIYLFFNTSGFTYMYNPLTDTYEELINIPEGATTPDAISVGKNIYVYPTPQRMCIYDINNNQYLELPNVSTYDIYKRIKIKDKIYEFSAIDLEIYDLTEDKTVLIIEGNKTFETQLINSNIKGRLLYSFDDVKYNTTEDGLDDTLPTYYGDGTQWIKFKN